MTIKKAVKITLENQYIIGVCFGIISTIVFKFNCFSILFILFINIIFEYFNNFEYKYPKTNLKRYIKK